jgi:hypothetical protein
MSALLTGWEGDVLGNGAVVISLTGWGDREGVALCVWKDSPDPYVVWATDSPAVGALDVFRGSYFSSLDSALAEYRARGGKT